jgi:plastocyanin
MLGAGACGPAATSPTNAAQSIATSSTGPVTAEPATLIPTPAPSPSEALASRCAVASEATAAATIHVTQDKLGIFDYDGPVTIMAGQSVTFVNTKAAPHTITEGINGVAADDACVDTELATGAAVTITFTQPGTYQFTCHPHPPMQTSVVVK